MRKTAVKREMEQWKKDLQRYLLYLYTHKNYTTLLYREFKREFHKPIYYGSLFSTSQDFVVVSFRGFEEIAPMGLESVESVSRFISPFFFGNTQKHLLLQWEDPYNIWVSSKNRGKTPKMDGESNGNPIKMDDFGGKPTIFGNIHILNYYEKQ